MGQVQRILVIDDEPLVATCLCRGLRDYDALATTSGRLALELLRKEHFDLVLCDLMMPELSGMDVYGSLRLSDPQLAQRMIFITGGAGLSSAQAFLASVRNPRLEKPFEVAQLRAAVATALAWPRESRVASY